MKILVIEDNDQKYAAICAQVDLFREGAPAEIKRAGTLAVAEKHIYESKYDLIIIDLMVPLRDLDEPTDISEDIISTIELSDRNRGASVIALTSYSDLIKDQRDRFTEAGILLVYFDSNDGNWKKQLSIALSRLDDNFLYDFVVVCALDKERNAYRSTKASRGELRNIRGLDCLPLEIAGLRGVCVKLPRMGLVDASIITSRAIDRFCPKIVAMSGICAGIPAQTSVGAVVIADPCWEYQAGKWAADGFKIEHYDIGLEVNTRTVIGQFVEKIGKGSSYKTDLLEDAIVFEPILIAPMATGSAVLADEKKVIDVKGQHRKIAAIEMEMYGVYKAAQLSAQNPIVFGAKTVVDMADNSKGDTYHDYGSILSARLVLDLIVELQQQLCDISE